MATSCYVYMHIWLIKYQYTKIYRVDKVYCNRFTRKNTCETVAIDFINSVDRKEHRGVYVRFLEMCDNPIGREETKVEMCGSAI